MFFFHKELNEHLILVIKMLLFFFFVETGVPESRSSPECSARLFAKQNLLYRLRAINQFIIKYDFSSFTKYYCQLKKRQEHTNQCRFSHINIFLGNIEKLLNSYR